MICKEFPLKYIVRIKNSECPEAFGILKEQDQSPKVRMSLKRSLKIS